MVRWRNRTVIRKAFAIAALMLVLALAVVLSILWFGKDWWKFLIGWKALVSYIDPQDATAWKDAVQVYAVIVAGVVAAITATVSLLNLSLTRRNLEHQRILEDKRSQGDTLQAYYEQIGKLITDKDLLNTDRNEIRELARGQTLTVLQALDWPGQVSLLNFLYGAGLIGPNNRAVSLIGANFRGIHLEDANLEGAFLNGADFRDAFLSRANFEGADLMGANLQEADLGIANLQGANLAGANLEGAQLQGAFLQGANLNRANLQGAHLGGVFLPGAEFQEAVLYKARGVTNHLLSTVTKSIEGAIMTNGQTYEEWREDLENRMRDEV